MHSESKVASGQSGIAKKGRLGKNATRKKIKRGHTTTFGRHSVAVFLTISVLQAFVWGRVHAWMGYDILAIQVPYISGPFVSIDGWSAIHVLTFVGCAALVPGRFWWLMLLGAVWEIYENAAAGGSWLFLVGGMGQIREFWQERGINSLWDIWFNIIGYRLGEFLLYKYGSKALESFGKALFIGGIAVSIVVAAISIYRQEISFTILDFIFLCGMPFVYMKLCDKRKRN